MPILTLDIPLGAVLKLLKAFDYDPAVDGSTPEDKEAFLRAKIVAYLKHQWRRGHRRDYDDLYVPGDDPNIGAAK